MNGPLGTSSSEDESLWKGVVAGAAAGMVGAYAMDRFQTIVVPKIQSAVSRAQGESGSSEGGGSQEGGSSEGGDGGSSSGGGESSEPATVKAAAAVSENVLGKELSKSEKKVAGPATHYTMGTVTGAIYGAAAEKLPLVKAGGGLPYGTAVWAVADETMVPAFGLSKKPWKYPMSTHAYALASHLVYGVSLELARRAIRRAL